MKNIVKFVVLIIIIINMIVCTCVNAKANGISKNENLTATQLGIGGCGMTYSPAISPFDKNTVMVTSDMGGLYISYNSGEEWERKNLEGVIEKTYFDPNQEGVLYAGGSGLYRSTNNGQSFELLFPKKDDVIKSSYKEEQNRRYLFTKSKIYPTYEIVKDVIVNPNDSKNIFVLTSGSENGNVFESKDNGETFEKIFSYQKQKSHTNYYVDSNKLMYQKETNTLYYGVFDGVFKYNRNEKQLEQVYSSSSGIVGITTVFENGVTQFIVIENSNAFTESETRLFYTANFNDITDITQKVIDDIPTSFSLSWFSSQPVGYKLRFKYITATSTENIYITTENYTNNSDYPYEIVGIIRYSGDTSEVIYGTPYKDLTILKNRGWIDTCYTMYGIAVNPNEEKNILFTTLVGIYTSDDCKSFKQCYSKVIIDENGRRYTTTGIDVQTTYGVRVNPFNENNIALLNTDVGLTLSNDNGETWIRTVEGINDKWINTVYDLEFDKQKENVVYSVWSGRHDAPYYPNNLTDGVYGGFAISYDGGLTWNSEYSQGLPANTIPVKMSVVYPENKIQDVTIYLATYNEGFFVSYDSGKHFIKMNNGIEPVTYTKSETQVYKYILGSDVEVKNGRIFGVTAKSYYDHGLQNGCVYEYINGKWEKINLGKNVIVPRDVYYHDETLYVSATAITIYDYPEEGVEFSNHGGGIYTYKNGEINQIFDESISVPGVQIDSNGNLYASDIDGNIYRKEHDGEFVKIYEKYHTISKGVQLTDDDTLYLAAFGGGFLRIEGLTKLQKNNENDTPTNKPNENDTPVSKPNEDGTSTNKPSVDNTISNTDIDNSEKKPNVNINEKDNTKSPGILPSTGIKKSVIINAIGIIFGIAIIIVFKLNKLQKDYKK